MSLTQIQSPGPAIEPVSHSPGLPSATGLTRSPVGVSSHGVSPSGPSVSGASPPGVDRLLVELRAGRRLEKVVSSIESFLLSQVARLNQSLEKCQQALDQHQIVQRLVADFEVEKQQWELERQTEIERLVAAGEDLMKGWEELERERNRSQQEQALAKGFKVQFKGA